MAIKYAAKPVVVAPFARTLGGGAEVALHAARCQASAELYMGLVEVGVGLIPGGGGCKELLLRLKDIRKVFELIGKATVSTSAVEAQKLGLLHREDRISMNADRLIADATSARACAGAHLHSGRPAHRRKGDGRTRLLHDEARPLDHAPGRLHHRLRHGSRRKLATVLSGGRLTGEHTVTEQYLLDLEREAFLSLLGQRKTQERMAHMLKTGKPLRN